jgi:hypothetical protein
MAVIFQRDFPNTAGKTGLRLGNEEFIRPLSIGSGWTRIRVSITCAIDGDGQTFVNGILFVGLLSGTQYGFNSPSCLGAYGFGSNAATYTFNANAGSPYYSASINACKKEGATASYAGVGTAYIPATTGTLRRTIITGGIIKVAGGGWSAYAYVPQTTGVSNYDARFYDHVNSSEAGFTGSTWFANATQYDLTAAINGTTLSFTEPPAGLNAVSICWNKSNYPLEIYSITVTRYV